jgi:hypothetical protein
MRTLCEEPAWDQPALNPSTPGEDLVEAIRGGETQRGVARLAIDDSYGSQRRIFRPKLAINAIPELVQLLVQGRAFPRYGFDNESRATPLDRCHCTQQRRIFSALNIQVQYRNPTALWHDLIYGKNTHWSGMCATNAILVDNPLQLRHACEGLTFKISNNEFGLAAPLTESRIHQLHILQVVD